MIICRFSVFCFQLTGETRIAELSQRDIASST